MFEIVTSTKFIKDLKLLKKRSIKDFQSLRQIITVLADNGHLGLDKKTDPINLVVNIKAMGNAM